MNIEEKSIVSKDGKKRKSVLVICFYCKKHFWKEKRFINRCKKHFCSNDCFNKNRRNRILVKCSNCNKDIYKTISHLNNKLKLYFCNRKCMIEARKNGLLNTKKKIKCLKCNNMVEVDSRASSSLCIECRPTKGIKNNYWDVINGIRIIKRANSGFKQFLFNNKIKEEKCEKCGLLEWYDKKIVFQLHHKDGNNSNNILENIEILCPNCHNLTENWGFKKRK